MKKRKLPITIVPDKTYIDAKGELIPTDVILITDLKFYDEMEKVLKTTGVLKDDKS